jgi:hypothetical protein
LAILDGALPRAALDSSNGALEIRATTPRDSRNEKFGARDYVNGMTFGPAGRKLYRETCAPLATHGSSDSIGAAVLRD